MKKPDEITGFAVMQACPIPADMELTQYLIASGLRSGCWTKLFQLDCIAVTTQQQKEMLDRVGDERYQPCTVFPV